MVRFTTLTLAARLGGKPALIVASRAVKISAPSRAKGKRSFTDPPSHRTQTATRNRGRLGFGIRASQAAPSVKRRGVLMAATTGNAQVAAARAAATRAAPSRTI